MNPFVNIKLPDSYAICLVGHGSREQEGMQDFLSLWQKLKERDFCRITKYGFLELGQPTVAEGVSACLRDGIQNIIILPGFLLPGEHTQKDIPDALSKIVQSHPEICFHFAKPLGTSTEVMKVCQEHIEEAEKNLPQSIPRAQSLLLNILHGSHDAHLNSQVEKNFHGLGKKLNFAKTVTHFAGTSQHSLEDMLGKSITKNFNRVLLFPFFLFTGVWVKRVYALADTFQSQYPNIECLKVSCLKHHEGIVDALIHQAQKSIARQ